MYIRIKNGTFGYREKLPDGTYSPSVRAKTRFDPPFEVDDEIGVWLISEGIAEAAEEQSAPPTEPAPADPEHVATCIDTPETENAAQGDFAPDGDPSSLDTLSFAELKSMAQDLGIDTRSLRSKAALIDALTTYDAEVEDDEQPPALDAGNLIV